MTRTSGNDGSGGNTPAAPSVIAGERHERNEGSERIGMVIYFFDGKPIAYCRTRDEVERFIEAIELAELHHYTFRTVCGGINENEGVN